MGHPHQKCKFTFTPRTAHSLIGNDEILQYVRNISVHCNPGKRISADHPKKSDVQTGVFLQQDNR